MKKIENYYGDNLIGFCCYGKCRAWHNRRPVTNSADVYQTAQSLVGKVDAIYVPTDNTVVSAFEAVVKVCERTQLPLFSADTDSVERGAIAALGFDYYLHGKQTGAMARKILAGTRPEALPVEFQ